MFRCAISKSLFQMSLFRYFPVLFEFLMFGRIPFNYGEKAGRVGILRIFLLCVVVTGLPPSAYYFSMNDFPIAIAGRHL